MNTSIKHELEIDIQSYWHAGTGAGSGSHLDALTEKDKNGLPFISGKHLKGLLRHAMRRAIEWNWFSSHSLDFVSDSLDILLFGTENQEENKRSTKPGMIQITKASLDEQIAYWLTHQESMQKNNVEETDKTGYLYTEVYRTKIDSKKGVAVEGSLRGIEVAIPMKLYAQISLQITALDPDLRKEQQQFLEQKDPFFWLPEILPLIDSVGANRNRGLGEATIKIKE